MLKGLARENPLASLIKPPRYNKTEKQKCTLEIKSNTKSGFLLRSAKLKIN